MTKPAGQPAHENAQRALIGNLLLRPQLFHDLDLRVDEFNLPDCRRIYEALGALWANGVTPDMVSVADWTERNEGRGLDALAVSQLCDYSDMTYQLDAAAQIIRSAAVDAKVRTLADRLVRSDLHGEELLASAMTAFNGVLSANGDGPTRLTAAIDQVMRDMERPADAAGSQVRTGIPMLDDLNLLDHGGVLTIAGRPSMGKSALIQYLATQWAQHGERVLNFSTETPKAKQARRFLSAASGVNSGHLVGRRGHTQPLWDAVTEGAARLHGLPIWIDDQSDRAEKIARTLRRMRQQHGITVAVVDHIQECIPSEDPRKEINQLISMLRSVCRETPKIALVLVSQLSRRVESREDRRPRMSDLKESGKIEEASDSILLAFRPHYYRHQVNGFKNADPGVMLVDVAKNRDGATFALRFSWDNGLGHVRGILEDKRGEG
jgi:replicative DNA helicase